MSASLTLPRQRTVLVTQHRHVAAGVDGVREYVPFQARIWVGNHTEDLPRKTEALLDEFSRISCYKHTFLKQQSLAEFYVSCVQPGKGSANTLGANSRQPKRWLQAWHTTRYACEVLGRPTGLDFHSRLSEELTVNQIVSLRAYGQGRSVPAPTLARAILHCSILFSLERKLGWLLVDAKPTVPRTKFRTTHTFLLGSVCWSSPCHSYQGSQQYRPAFPVQVLQNEGGATCLVQVLSELLDKSSLSKRSDAPEIAVLRLLERKLSENVS
jgi:hypothetical protein